MAFKKGDRVRCVAHDYSPAAWPTEAFPGDILEVEGTGHSYLTFGARGGGAWVKSCFELVQDEPASDPVVRPNHYARYTIEPATFIAANKLPFDVGNVVKYVLRFDAKNGIEDLEKARRYIDMTIERLRREARVVGGEDASEVWRAML